MQHRFYKLFILMCLLLLLGSNSKALAQSVTIPVSIYLDVFNDYNTFLDGRNPLNISDYSGKSSRRDVIEVVLFQQALALGGLDVALEMATLPTYLRTQTEISEGTIAATTTTLWLNELEQIRDDIYITEALVENGSFEAGLYTSLKNKVALSAQNIEDVRRLTAVSNKNWEADWKTLQIST